MENKSGLKTALSEGLKVEHRWKNNKFINKINPEISYAGVVTTNGGWRQEPIYASFSRLYYVLDGSGMLVSDGESMELEKGYVYLAPCGIKCGFYGTPSVTKVFFHINLSINEDGRDIFESFKHFVRLPRSATTLENVKKWYLGSDEYGHLMLKGELMRTICELLKISEEKYGQNKTYSDNVSRAISYICASLRASLTVNEVAEAALCSKSTLSAQFKSEVGQSVAKYIDELLMSEATARLLYSERSIGEISERLGFCDQFYFSRWFTRLASVSPKEYRKTGGGIESKLTENT